MSEVDVGVYLFLGCIVRREHGMWLSTWMCTFVGVQAAHRLETVDLGQRTLHCAWYIDGTPVLSDSIIAIVQIPV